MESDCLGQFDPIFSWRQTDLRRPSRCPPTRRRGSCKVTSNLKIPTSIVRMLKTIFGNKKIADLIIL